MRTHRCEWLEVYGSVQLAYCVVYVVNIIGECVNCAENSHFGTIASQMCLPTTSN